MTNENKLDQEHNEPKEPNNNRRLLNALLIGFVVGVMFIVSAKMVNMVIT